jgi:hypothetical protein
MNSCAEAIARNISQPAASVKNKLQYSGHKFHFDHYILGKGENKTTFLKVPYSSTKYRLS